ncbi:MAG TPA: adenylosuccinate synthase [Cyclobacteriaceae bacterium]|nr:adenylosuccinate synthase [Cyclobacteriaceae bacterium]HMV11280.1 adenylosuccinate synthase [Cyclobacteriaceae bacterium]HMV91327.1 adenylosuccinate synthase [Cyclobacteriaceae bacterium]HMX02967.1 adenylosuccinate synthase [Cyclobacteriaceae bacterium]HMX52280.1 adenylosuccinate synthase [Cyclobacteriaceae bacterium]
MSKVDVLLGLQWGDEGKGKIVDVLAPKYDVVARFQGGPNAGHTLEFDGIKHVLHQIPSGIFREKTRNIIGNGVVLDPIVFKKEIEGLQKFNLNVKANLYISKKATLIVPTHRLLDQAYEKAKGENKIGSTLKGIGPSYQDKIGRQGLRVGDILADNFKDKFKKLTDIHFEILNKHQIEFNWNELEAQFNDAVNFLRQFQLVDSEYVINKEITSGSTILAEGAQGSLLDIDFGSYPFVTSSNTVTAGACTGLGVAPRHIGEVYGIFKAYSTRVGSGPFPTELLDEQGEKLRKEGNEFGSTTGRPRRCGWIDIPSLKYSIMINGVTQLLMMKADVLSIFPTIRVCTQYQLKDGSVTEALPYEMIHEKIVPVYKEMKGWNVSLKGIDEKSLPAELVQYVSFLEQQLGVPITLISTGPDRTQTILRNQR